MGDLIAFQEHHEAVSHPFHWKFTWRDFDALVAKVDDLLADLAAAA